MMIGFCHNFGNVVAEFAGIAGSLELFGLSKYITVPVCAVIVWLIIVKGQYKTVEKVFLAASFFYITYIVAGVLRQARLDGCIGGHREAAAQAVLLSKTTSIWSSGWSARRSLPGCSFTCNLPLWKRA